MDRPGNGVAQGLPGLLRLSPQVRRRIYLHLRLASWDGRPYTLDLHGRKVETSWSSSPPPPRGSFFGLLVSCRAIYAEAAALLYSANQFVLYYSHPGSLDPLRALSAPSLASLARLKVILRQTSCHAPADYDDARECCVGSNRHCTACHEGQHQPPLVLNPALDKNDDKVAPQAVLSEWHSAVLYMSSYLGPERLELSLVCDVDNQHDRVLEAARLVVAPLRLLPPLKDCHIRLCKAPDARLQRVAHDAVLQARGLSAPYTKPSSGLTTLVTLPRELRLRILEYTDLITPSKEVIWSRLHHGYEVYSTICFLPEFNYCGNHDMCQFNKCWWTTNRTPSLGCFCHRQHAAFSSTCKCWVPPGASLFLVCRSLRQDAEFIFYSSNRFVIHDYWSYAPCTVLGLETEPSDPDRAVNGNYPFKRFAASQFLREVVPIRCLPYLRFLELAFPPYIPEDWPRASDAAMQDWWGTIDWVRGKVNTRGLTVRLIMVDVFDGESDQRVNREVMSASQRREILDGYRYIMAPLRKLAADGLARFYMKYVEPANNATRIRHDRLSLPWDDLDNWIRDMEQKGKRNAERFVMGDRYDNLYSNGKEEPAASNWQFIFARHY